MGEVYQARDTRLDRNVAIKVLPSHLSAQPENRERFEREARAVASLKHPNICTLHDIGEQQDVRFLVLELLEGESLADRLSRGPLSLADASRYGLEIADALDGAHRQGVVHRDLKPGNIMITPSGSKLLDFGLAKVRDVVSMQAFSGVSQLPTQGANLTAQGTILGTLQYMAPEQLEGREADARTDIFAFGVVLYEMITGRKAFEGKSQVSVIAAILEHEPAPLRSLQPQASASLDHVLARCLAKDPEQRWQSARDVAHGLRWATGSGATEGPVTVDVKRPGRRSQLVAWAVATVSIVTTAAVIGAWLLEPDVPRPTVRFEVHPPLGTEFPGGTQPRMMVSPDGTMVAFSATTGDVALSQLWVRRLDAVAAMPLPGSEGGYGLFWSPDSRFVGFFAGRSLKTIDVSGGPPMTISDVPGGAIAGPHGTWSTDGDILFSSGSSGGIHRVSAAGGTPTLLTVAKESARAHLWPQFLPGGRHFLYLDTGATPEERGIFVGSLDSTDVKRVLRSEYNAEFAQPGYLLFVRDRTLLAQRFDHEALELQGEPVRVAEELSVFQGRRRAAFSVSNAGTLVLRLGGRDADGSELVFHTFDRTGKLLARAAGGSAWRGFDLSPDGRRIAGHRHDDQGGDVWITDALGQGNSRLTFDPSQHHVSPIWSPDGSHVAFGSVRNGSYGIYRKAANGVGAAELLFESKQLALPMDWSADGQSIVFGLPGQTSGDLWRLPLDGNRTPVPFLQTPAAEMHAQLSPDGRWLVYASNETGRAEVFVQSYPTPGTKYQVSTNGGMFPRWRDDGKEILFKAAGRIIMSAMVRTSGQGLSIDTPQQLFDSGYVNFNHSETGGGIYHTFAVSPDGQRIIVPLQRDEGRETEAASPLLVVLNWHQELKQRVPPR
jgi:hypothetical protein